MRIAHNIPALNSYNALNTTNRALQKSIRALSTGLRISSAADDAAGLGVSERMRAQIYGMDQALVNTENGVSLVQTAEGALSSTSSILQRMRELSVQASNDTLTAEDRSFIQSEIDELKKQIDDVALSTQFNSKRLLDGSCGATWASSDLGLRAIINGGLTRVDESGRKISSEGNYKIELTTDPGMAQVQKSNIMMIMQKHDTVVENVVYETRYETVQETEQREIKTYVYAPNWRDITTDETLPHEIYIEAKMDILGETSGDGWNFSVDADGYGVLTITSSGAYNVVGEGNATTNRVVVAAGVENASVFLRNVNINLYDVEEEIENPAFLIEPGASAHVYLTGDNILKGGIYHAGLEVPDGASLVLTSKDGDWETTGSLTATGTGFASGIGGPGLSSLNGRAGNITINGGTIKATADSGGAGIGGGNTTNHYITGNAKDGGGNIVINGGDITADGSAGGGWGAGIGSGFYPDYPKIGDDGTTITITGGTVRATGGTGSAGIGGSWRADSGTIKIKSGVSVTATAGTNGPADIGRGLDGADGNIDLAANIERPDRETVPDLPTIDVHSGDRVVDSFTITESTTTEDVIVTKIITTEVPVSHYETVEGVDSYNTLAEISQFYDANGVCLLDQPQTITITQGNGKTASVTLYGSDTVDEAARKINDAIADELGQKAYVTTNADKFCTISDGTENTSESIWQRVPVYSKERYSLDVTGEYVRDDKNGDYIITGYETYATLLVRSAVPGKEGELTFSGSEDLLLALGLNTIQQATESTRTISISDAHTGAAVVSALKAEGSEFPSILPPEIDIRVDAMAGTDAVWDERTKRYVVSQGETYTGTLHLTDNTLTLQTGANQGEECRVQLGNMSSEALGVANVNVLSRENAERAITVLDRAINKVSSARARIGASQNALEYAAENLTTANTNVTAAESRIRDADMAKEMMSFVKLQILNQSGTSMLAQANQLPQGILALMQ